MGQISLEGLLGGWEVALQRFLETSRGAAAQVERP